MKLFATLVSGLLVLTMNGQIKKNSFELHTRPISLLQGIITLGAEVQVGEDVSILFDGGAGASLLDNVGGGSEIGLTTFMVGARKYFTSTSTATRRELLKKAPLRPLEGLYVTARHRSRFYSDGDYGANTNVMIGKKVMIDQLSIAGEAGVGRQSLFGEAAVLPTFAVTVGYRLQ
ncbi:MAG: hypothetical protein QNK59_01245 [Flavobacteriales bacterium]|jgi:hypothetical protein|tara:strand:- start:106 stop:630 length:525 start_codon:yes stop_codon:yes gene_type:complete